MPMEIQAIEIGPWKFVSWPGEHFVDYGLAIKARSPNTFIITMANGTLQGYLVTAEAAAGKFYEPGTQRSIYVGVSLLGASRASR
jgi:hypothetical protein